MLHIKTFGWIIIPVIIISCSKKEDTIQPVERALTESVYSSVTIQPDSLYQACSVVTGVLENNLVEEGALVSKGDALVQIINSAPKLNAENAKSNFDMAKENYSGKAAVMSGLKNQIDAANLKYKNDSINFYRQKNLWDQKIGSKVDYDTKKLNYELSKNNLKSLQNTYDRTKKELQTALKQSENNYQSAVITSKDFTVRSKINGKVYALYKEPGELVNPQEPIASIGSAKYFIVDMLVDEVDIVRIKLNQQVLISLDAYKGKVFKGKVSKIYPQKDELNQTFRVEAVFYDAPKVLYPGLSGEANIIIARKDKVLTIPKAYLVGSNSVKTEDGLKTIKLGLQNLEFVEVISGISKDDYILKP